MNTPWMERPYSLVSWWDMAQFKGEDLQTTIRVLERIAYNCATRNAGKTKWSVGRIGDPHTLKPRECEEIEKQLAFVERALRSSGLPTASRHAFEIRNQAGNWKIESVASQTVISKMDELQNSIRREMESHVFLFVAQEREKWYKDPRNGWEQAISRFSNTVEEIEECSRCFALERYGAAVFHAMLIAEIGAIEIGKLVQINDPKTGWPATIREMTRIVRKSKWDELSPLEQQHRAFLEQLLSSMESMQSGWRHKISHVENKLVLMTGSFKPEVAEEIIVATRGFMRRLATEMP
jgi:hypothetical protein